MTSTSEPPDADPPVRWCGRGPEGITSGPYADCGESRSWDEVAIVLSLNAIRHNAPVPLDVGVHVAGHVKAHVNDG